MAATRVRDGKRTERDAPPPVRPPAPAGAPPPAAVATAGAEDEITAQSARTALELAGLVIAATTFISALAFYFGWAVTAAKVDYFGIDASVVGFSTQDYILRSTDALFVALVVIVAVALAALAVHAAITRALADPEHHRRLRRTAVGGAALGTVLLAIGLWAAVLPVPEVLSSAYVAPSAGIGIALLTYCLHVKALVAATPAAGGERPVRVPRVRMGLAFVLVGLSAFWTTALFATELGRDGARTLGEELDTRPAVTVFSAKALHLGGAGAGETRLATASSAYRFRYSGLRLIFHAGGKYFLVADGWRPATGTAIVLSDDPALRFEFRPGSGAR